MGDTSNMANDVTCPPGATGSLHDEYETPFRPPIEHPPEPLTLGDLASFVTIRSDVYPQLESLDRSRGEQWAAERA